MFAIAPIYLIGALALFLARAARRPPA